MPTRRMRCTACGQAKDNYSSAMAKAHANDRVCQDCEAPAAAIAAPTHSASPQQQVQYEKSPPRQVQYEDETPPRAFAQEESPQREESPGMMLKSAPPPTTAATTGVASRCPHLAAHPEDRGKTPASSCPHHDFHSAGAPSTVPVSRPELVAPFTAWLKRRNAELTQPVLDQIVSASAPFILEDTEKAFAEAVVEGQHYRLMRRVADNQVIPDHMVHTMFNEVKEGRAKKQHGYEHAHVPPKKAAAQSGRLAGSTSGAAPMLLKSSGRPGSSRPGSRVANAQPPAHPAKHMLGAENYQMMGKHQHQDQYFTDKQPDDGTDFAPKLDSDQVLVGGFTAGQSFLRCEISDDEDYQQPDIQEPLRQGLDDDQPGVCPRHWEEFETLFSDMSAFSKNFLHAGDPLPGVQYAPPEDKYPKGCTSDVQKIEYILGYWNKDGTPGKLQRAVKNWKTNVTADVMVVPPPPPGPMSGTRFQPAFAGMFLFYFDDPDAVDYGAPNRTIPPFLYIIMASSGTGKVLGMYTNKVTIVPRRGPEPKMRCVETVTGAKFTPSSSSGSYYTHGMKVYAATGKARFLIDVYYGATPPIFFWNGNDQKREFASHLRVDVAVEPLAVKKPEHDDDEGGSIFNRFKHAVADVAESMLSIADRAIAPAKHIDSFVKSTIQKGMQMEKFTAPYLAGDAGVNESEVMELVFDPNNPGQNIGEIIGSDLISLINFTNQELGINDPPHVVSKAAYLKGPHLTYEDQTTGY